MDELYDVIVIGGGPAGLAAGTYLARARYRVLVLEKDNFGGQITITHQVVNYPGVAQISGSDLAEAMRAQAQAFGAEFLLAEAEGLELSGDIKTVRTDQGEKKAFGVLLATGARPRMVGFRGEAEFRGRGVAYCATCDGEFFTGKEIFVVGGGYAAAEEAVFLTKYGRHVTILVRKDDFSCARSVADAARANPKITVLTNTEVEEVMGDSALRAIRYRNNRTGEITLYQAEPGESIGVFVFAGYAPATELVKNILPLNEQGYVVTDPAMKTGVDGLYAAGDVCVKNLRQVVTAVADGALAATELEKYAAAMQRKTGLRPRLPQQIREDAQEQRESNRKFLDGGAPEQLTELFSRMENPLLLVLELDEGPVSRELHAFARELEALTDKLTLELRQGGKDTPCLRVCRSNGEETGLAFHGIPGGHEFTSFILGLYNVAGPGQPLDPDIRAAAQTLGKRKIQVLVSLSCTMCPELVIGAQRIAALNPGVTAEIYDVAHFPELREKYRVMSVPCLVVDDGKYVSFGRKNIRQLLTELEGMEP